MDDSDLNRPAISELINGFFRLWMGFETMLRTEIVQIPQNLKPETTDSLQPNHYLTLFFRVSSNLQDGAPTMGELAGCLMLSLSSTTRLVDWLTDAGYVKRVNDADDRRVVRVSLTESGLALHEQMREHIERRVSSILEKLPQTQRETLISLMLEAFAAGEQNQDG